MWEQSTSTVVRLTAVSYTHLVAMGADVDVRGGYIHAKAKNGRMCGTQIYLDIVSVGATMNIMLAAVLADGLTVIENAAKEPHIVDLANFLSLIHILHGRKECSFRGLGV